MESWADQQGVCVVGVVGVAWGEDGGREKCQGEGRGVGWMCGRRQSTDGSEL